MQAEAEHLAKKAPALLCPPPSLDTADPDTVCLSLTDPTNHLHPGQAREARRAGKGGKGGASEERPQSSRTSRPGTARSGAGRNDDWRKAHPRMSLTSRANNRESIFGLTQGMEVAGGGHVPATAG